MLHKHHLVRPATAGLLILLAGCTVAPTLTPPAPMNTGAATQQAQVDEISPDQLMRMANERQVLSTSVPMTFEQVYAGVPESLSQEEGQKVLVSIDPSQVNTSGNYSVQQYGGHRIFFNRPFFFHRFAFNPFFHNQFFFRRRFFFFPRHNFFFPFFFDRFRFRRFDFDDDFPFFFNRFGFPFFLRFHQQFFPFGFRARFRERFED
jgi:hypothetical protein